MSGRDLAHLHNGVVIIKGKRLYTLALVGTPTLGHSASAAHERRSIQ
jgi:hypothetical protein